jgi:DNA-binding NarL/FixJ family response regulator
MNENNIRKVPQSSEAYFLIIAEEYARKRFEARNVVEVLSPRENTVLQMFSKGLTADEICHVLGSTMSTVRSHIRSIYLKLDVNSSVQAVSMAQRHGLIRN